MWKDAHRAPRPGAGRARLAFARLPALALALYAPGAAAQSAAEWLLNPVADNAPAAQRSFDPDKPLFAKPPPRTFAPSGKIAAASEAANASAPSRIGAVPTYGTPPASGAGTTGFDSLNRQKAQAKAGKPADDDAALTTSRIDRTPVAASLAGTVPGQPTRRRLKVDEDPFAASGFYAGSFVVKPAIEMSVGTDSNPGRIVNGKGAHFYKIAPELVINSDWDRHALGLDLRGSFTSYDRTFSTAAIPRRLDRPDFTGKASGRIDVSHDTQINAEARLNVATDDPGSPDIQAGLARYPLTTSYGGTLGLTQTFNRFAMTLSVLADRTMYQSSTLTNGVRVSNADRDYSQIGGTLRAAYELAPGIKPFVEAGFDRRDHDLAVDKSGINRDSRGTTIKAGSSFELTRLVTGEASIGFQTREYDDPALQRAQGLLVDASLLWSATPLTRVKFSASSSINESTLPGVSGVLVREYGVEVDHDFRRWLTGSAKFTTSLSDYDGAARADRTNTLSGALVYKLTRTMQIKGEFRHQWLTSNVPGSDYTANVVMVGLRLQR